MSAMRTSRTYAGLTDADHARGKMARLWRQCTLEHRATFCRAKRCQEFLGERGLDALMKSRLGDRR
jgi:hypothetical protein